MPIDINGLSSNATTNNRTKVSDSGRTSGVAPVVKDSSGSTSASTDHVSLSGEAKALLQLEEHIKSLPVVDQDKVNHFRNAIASGSYQPNPENIATKMLDADN